MVSKVDKNILGFIKSVDNSPSDMQKENQPSKSSDANSTAGGNGEGAKKKANNAERILIHLKEMKAFSSQQLSVVFKICNLLEVKKVNLSDILTLMIRASVETEKMKYISGLIQKVYKANIVVGQKKEPVDTGNKEKISKYYKQVVKLFVEDILYNYAIEGEAKKKKSDDASFGFFINQIPLILELDDPKDLNLLMHKNVLGLFKAQVTKLLVSPLKKVFIFPGHVVLQDFLHMVKVSGQAFIELTAVLEKEGFISVNLKNNEMQFIVNRIDRNKNVFRDIIHKNTMSLENGEDISKSIMDCYQKSITIDESNVAYSIYNKIVDNSIILRMRNLSFEKESFGVGDLRVVYWESLLLYSSYKKSERNIREKFDDRYVDYSDKICARMIEIIKKEKLNAVQNQCIIRSLACLSNLPGKALKDINEYYKEKTSLEYDQFLSLLNRSNR